MSPLENRLVDRVRGCVKLGETSSNRVRGRREALPLVDAQGVLERLGCLARQFGKSKHFSQREIRLGDE